MSKISKIEWTDSTWNPITGCSKISPGCKNCYAERLSKRLKAMGVSNYANGFDLTLQPHMLDRPLKMKKSHKIFVNSMSDLFHEDVPLNYIQQVFDIMRRAHWHQFQVLTKRSQRMFDLSKEIDWPRNVWMGISVENSDYVWRIEHLQNTNASVKFLSIEPLIGSIQQLDLQDIDWVIVGGESGPHARPMKKDWVLTIKNICQKNDVPFFFKQWGGTNKKKAGRKLEGRTWNQTPEIITTHYVKT